MSASVANLSGATMREIVSTESHDRPSVFLQLINNAVRRLAPSEESAMADRERKRISAEDKFAEEMGVLVTFLDPHLKARREAKSTDPLAPWSARKALFFFLFATSTLWLVVLGVIYLLYIIL
jgi:hypothetical protein